MNLKRLKMALCGVLMLGAGSVALQVAEAYPKPGLIHKSWVFDYTSEKPRFISVKDANGNTNWYCYITYKVVNNTQLERTLIPEFTMASDHGDIRPAGKGVPYKVYAAISKSVNNKYMESPVNVVGKILRGEDFAKESVAIWPMFKHDVDEVNIFVSGLSGETQSIKHPLTRKPVVMVRTLMQTYKIPGTVVNYHKQVVLDHETKWIMR